LWTVKREGPEKNSEVCFRKGGGEISTGRGQRRIRKGRAKVQRGETGGGTPEKNPKTQVGPKVLRAVGKNGENWGEKKSEARKKKKKKRR